MGAPPTRPNRSARRRLSKSARIGLGLLLTFAGLVLLVRLLPSGASSLDAALPVAAAGILTLWIGGIFLGRANAP